MHIVVYIYSHTFTSGLLVFLQKTDILWSLIFNTSGHLFWLVETFVHIHERPNGWEYHFWKLNSDLIIYFLHQREYSVPHCLFSTLAVVFIGMFKWGTVGLLLSPRILAPGHRVHSLLVKRFPVWKFRVWDRLQKSISMLLYFWYFSSNDREIHLLGKLLRFYSFSVPFWTFWVSLYTSLEDLKQFLYMLSNSVLSHPWVFPMSNVFRVHIYLCSAGLQWGHSCNWFLKTVWTQ